jgi:hypothetical protein
MNKFKLEFFNERMNLMFQQIVTTTNPIEFVADHASIYRKQQGYEAYHITKLKDNDKTL